MSLFDTLELIHDPRGFATLWLNRAEKHNAFDGQMIAELNRALEQLAADASLRFVVLRGRGRHFSAGADLQWMRAAAQLDYAANLRDAQALGEVMYRLHGLPMPTLAVVHGAAFGGALGLISCCDMALGSRDATLCLSEVRIGLAPAVISPFVARAIGARAARRYALSAERFDAERAGQLGLFSEVCEATELEAQLARWVDNLLLNSPQALRASKALLVEVEGGAPSSELRQACQHCIAELRVSAEGQEGLQAFLQKRPPAWQAGITAQDPQS
ncbi:gamma-carboxygeranoyl-CoA hydratase [Pseudomonas cremoricolorata]|uniref:gamma-carboxygeranoyl-CoA hydratase n=1 Tax=Pseudomonas cremoricolorata TaxID=157783 RepID=UPI00041B4B0A|nr:gamma-carboxygeranoyl-CoA hydratase [Pseudomonas cremoricolorata]